MVKSEIHFEIKLQRSFPKLSTFVVLLFTEESWVKVPQDQCKQLNKGKDESKAFALTKSLELKQNGFLNIQLYGQGTNGLSGRFSQRLLGATSLQIKDLQPTAKTTTVECQLTRSDYFQASKRDAPATCSIRCPKIKLQPLKTQMKNYVAEKHEGKIRYKPATAFISNVYMPYYFDESLQSRLPGDFFMQFPLFAQPVRHVVWLAHFRKVVHRLFPKIKITSKSTLENVLKEIPQATHGITTTHLLADVIADAVTCYPYRPDIDESFDDVFFNTGGDCEDFAKGILRTWAELKRTAKASHRLPFFASILALMDQYDAWAALGSVLKRSYSTSDRSANAGETGHMFVLLIPKSHAGLYLGGGERVDKSSLQTVIVEGTAKCSYLAGTVARMNDPIMRARTKFTAPGAYEMQPLVSHSDAITAFYHQVAFLFTGDRVIFDKYGTGAFLAVNIQEGVYGVKIKDFLAFTRGIRMLPGRSHTKEWLRYMKRVYLPMQERYVGGIQRLTLNVCANAKRSTHLEAGDFTKVYFVDARDYDAKVKIVAEQANVKMVVREDHCCYCLYF